MDKKICKIIIQSIYVCAVTRKAKEYGDGINSGQNIHKPWSNAWVKLKLPIVQNSNTYKKHIPHKKAKKQ